MIYHSDSGTGVTVEDIEPRHAEAPELSVRFHVEGQEEPGVVRGAPFIKAASMLTDDEADALLIGLLRRKLETEGETAGAWWVSKQIGAWSKERSR